MKLKNGIFLSFFFLWNTASYAVKPASEKKINDQFKKYYRASPFERGNKYNEIYYFICNYFNKYNRGNWKSMRWDNPLVKANEFLLPSSCISLNSSDKNNYNLHRYDNESFYILQQDFHYYGEYAWKETGDTITVVPTCMKVCQVYTVMDADGRKITQPLRFPSIFFSGFHPNLETEEIKRQEIFCNYDYAKNKRNAVRHLTNMDSFSFRSQVDAMPFENFKNCLEDGFPSFINALLSKFSQKKISIHTIYSTEGHALYGDIFIDTPLKTMTGTLIDPIQGTLFEKLCLSKIVKNHFQKIAKHPFCSLQSGQHQYIQRKDQGKTNNNDCVRFAMIYLLNAVFNKKKPEDLTPHDIYSGFHELFREGRNTLCKPFEPIDPKTVKHIETQKKIDIYLLKRGHRPVFIEGGKEEK